MIKEYSILDAFRALDDLEEEVNQPKKESKSLTEGKSFDLGNKDQMEEAKTFIKESEDKEETEIQVIDVDADSLDHIKNNEEYIGQYILQCNACKTLRYVAEDKLQASENDPAIYNVEDECPHCHALNSGYALIGQVGRVEKAEPEFENDEAKEDELTFEKEEEVIEAPAEDNESEFEPVEEPEENPDEVAEDDTADMESTFGNEINSDETAKDDTEEEEEDEEAKLAAELGAALEDEEEEEKKKKEKKESFNREQAIKFLEGKGINCTEGLVATYAEMLLEEDADGRSELNEDFYYQETLDSIAWKVEEYSNGLKDHECWINEDFEPASPEEELAKSIVVANGLKTDNMNKSGTPEYFILKEIVEGPVSEDLYINYIRGLDEEIRKAFASLTGFDMEKAEFDFNHKKPVEEEKFESLNEEDEDDDSWEPAWEEPIDVQKDLLEVAKKLAANPEGGDELDGIEDNKVDDAACVLVACNFLNRPFSEVKELVYGEDYDYFKLIFTDGSEHHFYSRGVFYQGIKDAGEHGDDFGPVLRFPEDFNIKVLDSEFPNTVVEENELPIDEAKKEEEELPADPEAVKTEVHDVINNLVKDEIEAINGYEEAKAVIADTHIEHKDEIIDTIDHVEDEEKEHVDELIDAAKEIPFEKEEGKEEKVEEPIEEPAPEEVIPEVEETEVIEEPVEEAVKPNDFDKIAKEAEELEIKEEVETPVEEEPVNESVDIHIEGNDVTIKDNSGEDVAIIPVDPEAEETPTEEQPTEEEPAAEAEAEEVEEIKEPVEEGLEIDEKAINEAINAKLKETGNEDAIFETISGSFDDNSMLIEGNIISGDLKVPTKFRFENLEEEHQYKVTNTLSDEEYIINL